MMKRMLINFRNVTLTFVKHVGRERRVVVPARALRHFCVRTSSLTARGTVSLPPEGRHVYRPWGGMFTARGAVSNESAGKSDAP